MLHSSARASVLDALIELLSSMRFAISLLTVLAIASVIGTVVQQNGSPNIYLSTFGQFWDPVFVRLGLYTIYNTGWFIGILAFLVLSTTLCIVRHFTPMMREINGFHEHARETSLRLFACHASLAPTLPPKARHDAVKNYLAQAGFRFRIDKRGDGTLVAAKQGSLGRIGYFLAHGAIILICLGGLLDGNLPLSMQMRLGGKTPASGNLSVKDIPDSAWLGSGNWSFRGNIYIPEGSNRNFAVLNVDDGVLLQPLPFRIDLKRFHIDHYESGMPKRYASDLVITDNDSNKSFEYTLEVNKPLEYRGITLYQAGFDDGGSLLRFNVRGLTPDAHPPFPLETRVGEDRKFGNHTLEITGFRLFNIENIAVPDKTDEESRPGKFFGSGKNAQPVNLRNFGPSMTYKLRDAAGQALEYHNYMQPIELANRLYLYAGVRASQAEPYRYLRIPLDDDGSADTWFAIRQSFFDPARQAVLAERFATRNSSAGEKDAGIESPEAAVKKKGKKDRNTVRKHKKTASKSKGQGALHAQPEPAGEKKGPDTEHERLKSAAESTLDLFARGGLGAISNFIENSIPKEQREKAGEAFAHILQGLTWDAWMIAREAAGQKTLEPDNTNAPFVRDSFVALADSLGYGAPFYLQPTGYEQRQASILQATRSPGKPLVYLGSLLLALGVLAMLYIRERRLFVLLKDEEALVAISSNRKTVDLNEAFARHRDGLAAALGATVRN